MGQVFIESRPVSVLPCKDHIYPVYRNDNGDERVTVGMWPTEVLLAGSGFDIRFAVTLTEADMQHDLIARKV